jgi:hypothetical protein
MSVIRKPVLPKIDLRRLQYSRINPLIEPHEIELRNGLVRAGGYEDLVNPDTGQARAVSVVLNRKIVDDEHFVKMFAAGIAASFELNKTSQRVLAIVLDAYQRAPMSTGYCDWLELFWFGDGLDAGTVPGMSEKTFQRGLKDLLARGFLAPRSPNTYWTNPHLFFKGSRALFVTEYVKASAERETAGPPLPADLTPEEVPY